VKITLLSTPGAGSPLSHERGISKFTGHSSGIRVVCEHRKPRDLPDVPARDPRLHALLTGQQITLDGGWTLGNPD
jgi:hypothetical protein